MAELDCKGGETKQLAASLAPCLGKISKEKEHEKRMISAAASLKSWSAFGTRLAQC